MARYLKINYIIFILLFSVNEQLLAVEIRGDFGTFNLQTKNWKELKQKNLIRQQWDISCGAAALSTLMTWYHFLPLDEKTVVNALFQTTKVDRVRARGGFSLLDLKRFVEAIGYRGDGFGDMSVEGLLEMNKPAILPIYLHGLDHFVVYKGKIGDRFYIGDPAFGNISLTQEQLYSVWKSRIAFYVGSANETDFKSHSFHASLDDTNIAYLSDKDWSNNYSILPLTRRSRIAVK